MTDTYSQIDALSDIVEVSKILKISKSSVERLAARGTLPKVRIGGRVRFRKTDIIRLIEAGTDDHDAPSADTPKPTVTQPATPRPAPVAPAPAGTTWRPVVDTSPVTARHAPSPEIVDAFA